MKSLDFGRYALSSCVATVMLSGCGGSQPPIGAPTAANDRGDSLPYHKTFHYIGAKQKFKVPAGVTKITVVARGAAGNGDTGYYGNPLFGRGGRVHAIVPVHPGETLYVFVGGRGYAKGGFNGGGDAGSNGSGPHGYGGGGASDVREGGDTLTDRILVAGGGGGQGYGFYNSSSRGGNGGGAVGGMGYGYAGGGGGGGTQSDGGFGGAGDPGSGSSDSGQPGNPGAFGVGGSGGSGGSAGNSYNDGGAGGGGGGGYYGGGGGGGGRAEYASIYGLPGGGGGGGSSYIEPSAIKFHGWQGWKNATGDGLVVFRW
jgi:hypothetical protein